MTAEDILAVGKSLLYLLGDGVVFIVDIVQHHDGDSSLVFLLVPLLQIVVNLIRQVQQQVFVLNSLQIVEARWLQLLICAPQLFMKTFHKVRQAREDLSLNVEVLLGVESFLIIIVLLSLAVLSVSIFKRLSELLLLNNSAQLLGSGMSVQPLLSAEEGNRLGGLQIRVDKHVEDLDLQANLKEFI